MSNVEELITLEQAYLNKKRCVNHTNMIQFGSHGISIEKPEFSKRDSRKVIIPEGKGIHVRFEYPLSKEIMVFVKREGGWTKNDIGKVICDKYREMYEQEEKATTIPIGTLPKTYNRNKTNGPFGIWGHSLDNLILMGIYKCKGKANEDIWALVVDS